MRRIRLLYGILDRLQRRAVVPRLREAVARDGWTADELGRYAASRLEALLDHCLREVPFHRERLGKIASDPRTLAGEAFARIPPLEKDDVARAGERLLARGGPTGPGAAGTIAVTSGGTTGPPTRIFVDRDAHDAQTAATLRSFLWFGADPTRPHALLWGPPPQENTYATLPGRLRGLVLRRTLLATFGLDAARARACWEHLRARRLNFVAGYSSALVLVAAARKPGERCSVEAGVVAAAEPLFDFQRAGIEEAFGAPVRERYGCNEFALLAQECERGSLHVAADRVRLEVVREDGTAAAAGEVGSVLVTDLDGRLMPLLRYRVGDLAARAEGTCACGRPYPRLERVHGRDRDLLRAADGAPLTPHAFAAALEGKPVRAFQVVAGGDRRPRAVDLVGDRFPLDPVIERWRALAGGAALEVRFVDEVVRARNGKILPVVGPEAAGERP